MAAVLTKTAWGYAVTCTGGTAVPAVVVPKDTRVRVIGIACGGAATTDITTVQDANLVTIFIGSSIVNTMNSLVLSERISSDGLAVGFAGATTGYVNIYLAQT